MRKQIITGIVSLLLAGLLNQSVMADLLIGEAIEKIANRLQDKQIKKGLYAGSWPQEDDFTGSITAGIAHAYTMHCNELYKNSAELGGNCIFLISQGNFYGEEVYALTMLSKNSTDPNNNPWKTTLADFYHVVKYSEGGTEQYIDSFSGTDNSIAVLNLSYYLLGAYYVDANDKQIWRQELISHLSYVNDSSYYPVMALGAALWALSKTGPLDPNTPIQPPSGQSLSYWNSKKLSDLPALLMNHQVQNSQSNPGSFYWQLTFTPESPHGYTEDAIFATLGLDAAYSVSHDPNLYSALIKARDALLKGITQEGRVYEHLSCTGDEYYVYSGEMLEVLTESIIPGDIDYNGTVDLTDFEIIYNNLNASECDKNCRCNGADLDYSNTVDILDFKIFLDNWLLGMEYQNN
jgi:hypothetical protein